MKKRGLLEIAVYLAIFLVISIPFYVADVFAEEDNIKVKYVNSELFETGKFGKITALSLDHYPTVNTDNNFLNLPLAFLVITGSLVLLSLNIYAVLLLSMLVMLPAVSKKVNAAEGIWDFKVKGSLTGVEGFADTTEDLVFTVGRAKVDGDNDITTDQLELYDMSSRRISTTFSCIGPDVYGEFECDSNPVPNEVPGLEILYCPEAFTLRLVNDTGSVVGSAVSTLLCDELAPSITSVGVDSPLYGSGDTITLSYTLTDNACYGTDCTNKCSGFGSLRIEETGDILDLSMPPNTCSHPGSSLINASDLSHGDVTLTVTVFDNVGNEGSAATTEFSVDLERPVISDLRITKNGNTVEYLANGTTAILNVSVNITDADGFNINTTSVKANLSELGVADTTWQSQTGCDPGSGSSMICYWTESVTLDEDTSGTLYFKASDANGNLREQELYFSLNVISIANPSEAPIINSINITKVGGAVEIPQFLKEDTLSFTANVTSSISVSVKGNFSLIGGSDEEIVSCTEDGDYWICNSGAIEIERVGFYTDNLTFNAVNMLGTSSTVFKKEITVYTVLGAADVDYWGASVLDSSPSGIDKQLIEAYDPFIWFPVELNPNGTGITPQDQWPISVSVGECWGNDTGYMEDAIPELTNYNPDMPTTTSAFPYTVYLKFTLERTYPADDELEIPCSLKISTFANATGSISGEETENGTFNISYYYNPYGVMDENIESEIERIKSSPLVKAEFLDTAENLLRIAKVACSGFQTIYGGVEALAAVKDSLSLCCDTIILAPICCPAASLVGAGRGGVATAMEGLKEGIIGRSCKIISCQLWADPKWVEGKAEWVDSVTTFAQRTGTRQGYFGNIDPQGSLIMSVAFLCLPGIIYNLQKARTIDCVYINCLKQTPYGIPSYMCTSRRSYAYCKYVVGEIFNVIPFAAAIGRLFQYVGEALRHPIQLFGIGVKALCRFGLCVEPLNPGCTICSLIEFGDWLLDLLCDLGVGEGRCEPIWEHLWVDETPCSIALQDEEE